MGTMLEALMLPEGVAGALRDLLNDPELESKGLEPGEREDLAAAADQFAAIEAIANVEAAPMTRAALYGGLRSLVSQILDTKKTIATISSQLIAITEDDAQATTLLGHLEQAANLLAKAYGYQIQAAAAKWQADTRKELRDHHAADKKQYADALAETGGDKGAAVTLVVTSYLAKLAKERAKQAAEERAKREAEEGTEDAAEEPAPEAPPETPSAWAGDTPPEAGEPADQPA